MSRPKLTGLGQARAVEPPVYRCACGCGQYAYLGLPGGRWYVEEHMPAAPAPAALSAASHPEPNRAHPADLFDATGVSAPTGRSRPARREAR